MKRIAFILLASFVLITAGCGSSDNVVVPIVTTQILSNALYDGDIANPAGTGTLTIAQGNTQKVFAGFDPLDGSECRAFLNFPLNFSGGVPGNAVIVYATLELFINAITPNLQSGTIPVRIDIRDPSDAVKVGGIYSQGRSRSVSTWFPSRRSLWWAVISTGHSSLPLPAPQSFLPYQWQISQIVYRLM